MIKIFSDLPEALENNFNFPFKCNYKPKHSLPIFPNIKTRKDIDIDQESMDQFCKDFSKLVVSKVIAAREIEGVGQFLEKLFNKHQKWRIFAQRVLPHLCNKKNPE